ncbi:MAG: SEC-C domain-containing protein [Methanophagales archaeon]|nr:SEC-C domain-containing protein [Methanophagales archaeon]
MVEEYSDEEKEEILDKVYEWGVAFSESKYFEELTEEEKQESEFVVLSFTEYMYSYEGLSPEEWDEEELEECCLDVLPRKISADESYFRSIAPVLSAFFSFVEEKRLLRNASNLARGVKEIDKQIVKNASDPKNWGSAKSFVMAAKEAGVDTTNEVELKKFMVLHNLQQLAKLKIDDKPRSKSKVKIGRNDPCPCGSGKKYKKCCGRYNR